MITWGIPIYLYLWLAGMAAGAYFTAFLAERFGKHTDHRLLHIALYLGIPAAMVGVIFLLFDLSYPLSFWRLFIFFNLTSPMSIGGWLLILWMGIGVLIVFLWLIRNRVPIKPGILNRIMNYLHWAGFFVSVFIMSYTGVLLAVSIQPLWATTFLLSPLFVVSAVSTGAAILILTALITRTWKVHGETIKRMIQVDAVVIAIEFVILLVYLLWLYQSKIPGANESMVILTAGILAVRFWLGVISLAIIVPFALDIAHWGKKVGEHRAVLVAAVVSSACVIFGGLMLRIVIVIAGQI